MKSQAYQGGMSLGVWWSGSAGVHTGTPDVTEVETVGDKTGIAWTEATWNPTTGCDRVSHGCDSCYAMTMAARLKRMGSADYQNDGNPRTSGPGFAFTEHEHRLDQPLRWKRPRMIFVDSMSDLFHPAATDQFLDQVFDVMAAASQHRFQVLTKRAQRMTAYLTARPPASNVWVGVSIESDRYTYRANYLRTIPASVRFISAEPLLGSLPTLRLSGIGWVIVGGESGTNARPMKPHWVRELRDSSAAAQIPFFFKQWGAYQPDSTGAMVLDRRRSHEQPILDGVVHAAFPEGTYR